MRKSDLHHAIASALLLTYVWAGRGDENEVISGGIGVQVESVASVMNM